MKQCLLTALSFLLINCSPINVQIKSAQFINSTVPNDAPCTYINTLFQKNIEDAIQDNLNPYLVKLRMNRALRQMLSRDIDSQLIKNYTEKWLLFFKEFRNYQNTDLKQNHSSEQILKQYFKDFLEISKTLNLQCIYEESYDYFIKTGEWNIPFFNSIKTTNHKTVYGAKKVMSTVYQSCDVVTAKTISMEDTLNIKGVSIIQKHSQGGWNRKIIDKQKLFNSHFYLKYSSNLCHNVTASPVIYDFGGKPSFYSSPFSTLDFFTNQGSGSAYLGIDCSGFVFSALASSGLRLKPNQPIQLSDVLNIGAANFKTSGKFKCLETIDTSHDIPFQEGDIIASKNHVLIVDTIFNNDPFGLKSITNSESCNSLDPKNFNFIVIQSSPTIGINRMHAREFDSNNYYTNIEVGLKKLAEFLCFKKFQKKSKKFSEVSVIRHKQTEECIEKEIYLQNQECLKYCSSI